MDEDYDEYRCSACKKAIKSKVVTCTICPELFYHPGCVIKHKVYNKSRELVLCNGPFEDFIIEVDMKTAAGSSGSRLGSAGSGSSRMPNSGDQTSTSSGSSMDDKINWLVRTVKEMRDVTACKTEVKRMIKEVVREEMGNIKQELQDLRSMIQAGVCGAAGMQRSYSGAVKEKKKETVIVIKPKIQQESEATKKLIKEKVDIKNMAMGVTKLKKGSRGTVIMGCETGEEMKQLKATVQSKLGKDFSVTESLRIKPKIKVINIDEEELKLDDDKLIHTVVKQNGINALNDGFSVRIMKRLVRGKSNKQSIRREGEGSIILEVDEETHQFMLRKEKLNVGWRKCPIFNHVSVKRCFKCWGFYHIAKNCTREETCHKCAGNHKATECTARRNKCVNCMFKNRTYNLKINDEHDALSIECPTLKRAIQEEKRRAGWEDTKDTK